jgi:hypothetical protein
MSRMVFKMASRRSSFVGPLIVLTSTLNKVESVRNFPCQTLKISKVSLVVMGS